jgi:SpoVK/Ycf46/Vps4 family AAA+-type ATPase
MKSQVTISPNGENLSIEEVFYYQTLVDDGYVFPIAEVRLESFNFEKIKTDLIKKYNIEIFKYHSDDNKFEVWKCEEFHITIVKEIKNTYINSFCKSEEDKEKLFKIIQNYEPKSDDITLYMDNYFVDAGRLNSTMKLYSEEDFKYTNELFYPYIYTDIMFKQLFSHNENILILCGEPGTGKTSLGAQLLDYSMKNMDLMDRREDGIFEDGIQAAYIKSTEVLAMDEFWRTLASKEYDLVFLDDLDYFLTSRDQEIQTNEDAVKNKFLSQFLSFTDGIEQNKTKFVITTNQPFDDIDDALLRKGRLFDILELRRLTNDEALTVWVDSGLSEKEFIFDGDVLQADLGSEIEKHLNKEVKIETYLSDESISKLKKFNKKLGF